MIFHKEITEVNMKIMESYLTEIVGVHYFTMVHSQWLHLKMKKPVIKIQLLKTQETRMPTTETPKFLTSPQECLPPPNITNQ